jgi:hypothetical protein
MSDTETDITQIQGPRDLFSIRSQLAQHANPLRAKIVLFSLLYRPFTSNSGDWSTLKQQDLGEFIRRVYNKYASLEDLKRALTIVTAQLDDPTECDQAATAIYSVLKPYYLELETVTDSLGLDTDDLDNSQTWDIPIGVALKDADSESDDRDIELPTTGVSLDLDTATEVDTEVDTEADLDSAISQPTHPSDTDLSNATTALLPDPTIAQETDQANQAVDADFDEDQFDDDLSTDDHSRWLDSFGSAIESEIQSEIEPGTDQRPPETPITSELPIVTTSDLERSVTVAPSVTPASPEPPTATPAKPDASKRNGRRTALAQLLTQHVNSRDEVDAIVQRYSKTLTEQVTSALDDLEDELADCLGNCNVDEATQIAGEALGRVLLSVSDSIEQMRQALESIPGVEPIVNDGLYTRPPQLAQPPETQPPQSLLAINPSIAASAPETSPPQAAAVDGGEAMRSAKSATDRLAATPAAPTKLDQADPAIDPVQQIRDQFATLLAKRDMSIAVKQRDGCIHIIAEASPLPERTKLIRFVSKTLNNLDLPPIATLRLHGRRTGARAFDWSEDLPPVQ